MENDKNMSAVNYSADCRNGKWRTFKFEFDLNNKINYFNTIQAAESNNFNLIVDETTEDTLDNLVIAIQLSNKNECVLIDNVSFNKK